MPQTPRGRFTRRQALLAGGGAVAALGAAAAVVDPRRVYRRLTHDCGPEAAAPPRHAARGVLPLCAEELGLDPPRALLGWSMGGYGALLAAQTRPGAFRAVVASSPAIWTGREEQRDAVPDAFDSGADFGAHDVVAGAGRLGGLAVRVDCGESDPFAEGARRLISACPERPAGGLSVGCHDERFWRRMLPAQLDFVGAAPA